MLGLHAAYNLLVLLSFPAAGLAAYGLARRLTGDPAAAVVAGIGFALLPARTGPLFGGHPAGFAMALVPAMLWGLDVALREGRIAGGVGGGAALIALAMLEPQYTYLAGGLALAHAGMRVAIGPGRRLRLAPLLTFAVLALVAAGWVLMLRQAFVAGSIAEAGRRLDEIRLFSPVFVPSPTRRATAGSCSPRWRSSASEPGGAPETRGSDSSTGRRSPSVSC